MTTQELIDHLKQADPSGNALVWMSVSVQQETKPGFITTTTTMATANHVTSKPIAGPSYFTEVTISNQPQEHP